MAPLVATILDFQIFIFFHIILNLNTENSEKTTFRDWNLLFSEKLHFCSQHTSCMTYYDDIRCLNKQRTVVPKLLVIGQETKI